MDVLHKMEMLPYIEVKAKEEAEEAIEEDAKKQQLLLAKYCPNSKSGNRE